MKQLMIFIFLAFGLYGNLFCSPGSNNEIQGAVELFVKYNGTAAQRLFGITIGNDSIMYIVGGDVSAVGKYGYVSKVTPDGKEIQFVKFKSSFVGPGVDVDNDGNLFIAGGNNIYKITKDGKVDTLLTGFNGAFDIKVDPKGNLYIADHKEDKIYKVTPQLQKTLFIDNHASSLGSFVLGGLDFDKDFKYLYSVEESKKIIRKYPLIDDGTAGEPETILLNAPAIYSFDIDKDGNLFSTDYNKAEFVKVDREGHLTTLSSKAGLKSPMGFSMGKPGFHENSLFVADAEGIKRITQPDSITSSVGSIKNTGPGEFQVFPNYPNPFNPETVIRFNINMNSNIKISIYDSVGRMVKTILDKNVSAGVHEVKWDGKTQAGSNAASGIYYYQVKSFEYSIVKKMALLR